MKREFWFVVGSQFLYGPEVLEIVEARAKEMAAELSKALPYPLVYKVTAKTNKEITDAVKQPVTVSIKASVIALARLNILCIIFFPFQKSRLVYKTPIYILYRLGGTIVNLL